MNDDRVRAALTEFEHLTDLDADQRKAALARLAARDAGLAQLVQALLDQDDAPSPWLQPGQSHDVLLRGIDDDSHRAGEHLGPFVLLRRLGRGGMGEVWEAQRADGEFAQRVALKILHGLALSPIARQRFLRERQVLARLEHPGIARLIDGGIESSGIAWLALEFVDGEAIVAHVRRARLTRVQRVVLLESVCDALASAHRQFVLHRDIKPANVLVDREGRARLLDFGIARLLDNDEDDAANGPSPRTPRYAAPELVRGEATGIAADVYQLGLLLDEVLADADVPANRRDVIDADLAAIVAKATAGDPRKRHASAADLAADLARWRGHFPVSARPAHWAYRSERFVARHRVASALGVLAVVAILSGLAGTWRYAMREQVARAAAEVAATQAIAEAATARGVSDVLTALFTAADPYVSNHRDLGARDVLLDAATQLQRRTDLAPTVWRRLVNRIAGALDRIGELAAARPLIERAATQAGEPAERSLSLSYLAELERADGHFEPSRARSREALALARAAGDEGRNAQVTALTVQASTEAWDHQYEAAIALLREALPVAASLGAPEAAQRIQAEADLGHFLIYLEQFDEAGRHLEAASAAAAREPQRWRALGHHIALSQIYLLTRQRRYADALAEAERRLPESDELHGAASSNGVQLRQLRARALVGLKRQTEAVAAYRAIDALLQEQNAPLPRRLENGWFIALTELDATRYAQALEAAEHLIALSANAPDAAQSQADFVFTAAEAELGLGRGDAARRRLAAWPLAEQKERAARLPLPLLRAALAAAS